MRTKHNPYKPITNIFIGVRGVTPETKIKVVKRMSNGDLTESTKTLEEVLEEYYNFRQQMQDD